MPNVATEQTPLVPLGTGTSLRLWTIQVRTEDEEEQIRDCYKTRDWLHDDGGHHHPAYLTREAALAALDAAVQEVVNQMAEDLAEDTDEPAPLMWHKAENEAEYDGNGYWFVIDGQTEGRALVAPLTVLVVG